MKVWIVHVCVNVHHLEGEDAVSMYVNAVAVNIVVRYVSINTGHFTVL